MYMNRYKKKALLACAFLTALNIAACGQVKEDELVNIEDFAVNQQESDIHVGESTDSEDKGDETINAEESSVNQQENSAQAVENAAHTDLSEEPEEERQSIPDEVFDTNEPLDSQKKENSDGKIKKDDKLEILAGEYEYQSDYGTGKLIIKKTAYGYNISDYESESSYRFLADSSNIDIQKNNRIYIKYPEQVFSDDTVIFSYYILEYSTDGINVYYTKFADEEGQFLYHAARKSEGDNH